MTSVDESISAEDLAEILMEIAEDMPIVDLGRLFYRNGMRLTRKDGNLHIARTPFSDLIGVLEDIARTKETRP